MYKAEFKIINLWENSYKQYVTNRLLTKVEAFKMMANELNLYIEIVKKKIESYTS